MVNRLLSRARHIHRTSVEHEQLTSLINSMADGVIAVDHHMKIVTSNGAALNILDVNDTLLGKRLREVLHPRDKNNQPIDIEEAVNAVKTPTTSRDLLLQYNDGSRINLYLSIAPVHLGYGKRGQRGYVLLMRDITHEKSLEEERDEFISVVSHELRTPIAITEGNISNAQYIAEKTGDIEQVKIALKQAHDQTLFLADMINDLATLSRAERGKLVVDVEAFDVAGLMETLAKTYAADAQGRGLKIMTDVPDKLPQLRSSQLYVREILQNFVTNALKYTEQGSITIGAKPQGTGICFTVKDTGIGISKGDQEKLFDKFFRSEDFRTRKTNGTGLGLYVTMKLARLLHAEIDVKSQLNHGSTFSIFVPNLE
jgi:two-component system phosphate regulon sensor histidine kinase PhoR